MKSIITALVWFIVPFVCVSHAASSDHEQTRALERLAVHSVWLKLLAYESSEDNAESTVISPEFFLSENGKTDPLEELHATLTALAEPAGENPNEHAQCLFRGRYIWLGRQIDLSHLDIVECPNFDGWVGEGIDSISFILATGYLGNPASFYGHTLIKLNSGSGGHSNLLDQTINYGAIIPDGENPLVYIVRGISGLYEAGFTNKQYYYHNHNYGETQLRDQWEYELDLSRSDVELVVAHAWELLGKKYDYYFFTYNCAYRMAELFEIIEGISFIPNRTMMIPQTFFQSVAKAQYRGRPLVKRIRYYPSRQQRLYQRYELLDKNQRDIIHDWVKTPEEFAAHQEYQQLEVPQKQAVVDTLLDYYQYHHSEEDDGQVASIPNSSEYVSVLRERFRLPLGQSDLSSQRPDAPHQGRNPALFQTAAISTSGGDYGLGISYRPAYYDALDARAGHVKNGKLAMGSMAFTLINSSLKLDFLDAIAIDSTNGAITGLPGDSGFSWRLRGGVLRQTVACDQCLIPRISGSMGLAHSLSESVVTVGYVDAAVQDNRNDSGYLYGAGTLQLIARYQKLDGLWSSQLRHHIDSSWGEEWVHKAELRYELSINSEVRLKIDSNRGKRYSLSYGVYW